MPAVHPLYKMALAGVLVALCAAPALAQQDLLISTEQETYYYGDYLSLEIIVPHVGGDTATLYITDMYGKGSSPIIMAIAQKNTTLVSPFPFESQVYPTGRYTISVQYDGAEAETWFYLGDSGRTVIPVWIKDVGRLWTSGVIADEAFAGAIVFMIQNGMIDAPHGAAETAIPPWVKASAEWWVQGHVTDDEFAGNIQFLIRSGVITV